MSEENGPVMPLDAEPAGTVAGGSIRPRVLVVDDDAAICTVYASGLEQGGCKVATAGSGREALQILMRENFEVLVVDVRMEGMDGLVFLQEALNIWPWLGVVIVSAYVNDDVRREARSLGVSRLLMKPVAIATMREEVLAEANEKRARQVDISRGNALELMRHHMKLLTRLGQAPVTTDSLVEALLEFGREIAGMLPASAVGTLLLEGSRRMLVCGAHAPVTREFLNTVESEMIARFEALSGLRIEREMLDVEILDENCDPDGATEPGTCLSVPIIFDRDVCGLVTLAAKEKDAYSEHDVCLLYHAANHVSAVFTALRRMHHLAAKDPLTGLYNRVRLEEELERAWDVSRRYGSSMGVVIVDIDSFKILNDSYGHAVGDQVLRDFSRHMQDVARTSDILARYGGDEFVVILPHADDEDARTFGERLIEGVRGLVFCEGSHNLHLSVSVGIATSLNPTVPGTSQELVSQADRALYTAKRAGRDRICVWPERQPGTATRRSAGGAHSALPSEFKLEKPEGRILVVDDEPAIRDLVLLMLEHDGYKATACSTASEAIEVLSQKPGYFDILLTDLGLPGKSGVDLLNEVGETDDLVVKVVMTGYATVDNAVNSLREGAYDFVQKPIQRQALSSLIKRALEYRALRVQNVNYQAHLEEMVEKRSAQLAASLEEVKRSYEFTLEALVAMLDAREHHTGRHSIRVRELAVMLGREMGLPGADVEAIASGALLHDIGKIAIPDAILFRPGPLSAEEWEVMKRHPEIGFNIISSSPYLTGSAEIVYAHHERFDGSGYPRGLAAEEICIGARIFGIVDAYDAMRSVRVYREPVCVEDVVAEISRCAGSHFDPEVVEAFKVCQPKLERAWQGNQDH